MITPEGREKAKQTRLAKKAERQANSIEIPPYRIVRVDEYNFQIQGPNLAKDGNYYYDIETALKRLPATMLNAEAKTSLAVILDSQTAIRETVEKALNEAKRLNLLKAGL